MTYVPLPRTSPYDAKFFLTSPTIPGILYAEQQSRKVPPASPLRPSERGFIRSSRVSEEASVALSCGYLLKWYPFFFASALRIGGASIIAHTAHQINEEIHDKEVRLISAQGERLGIMPLAEAMAKAGEADLDLVKISPTPSPPRLQAHGLRQVSLRADQTGQGGKENQRIVEIKEVRMSPGIDVNDFNVKVRNAQRFLSDGNRVKVTVRFRGREMAHTDIGKRLLEKFAEDCTEVATMDKEPKLDGRHMTMFLSCRQNKDAKKETKK